MFTQTLLTIFLAMPGGSEWIFILLAVVLLFGGRKIPELMKGIGKGLRDFNDAKNNIKNDLEEGMKEKDFPNAKPAMKQPDLQNTI